MKEKQPRPDELGFFNKLSKDSLQDIVEQIPFKSMQSLLCTSKANYQLFKAYSKRALTYVINGKLSALLAVAYSNPQELFLKHTITDPHGRIFRNVSALQMITFLCDADMLHHIMKLKRLSDTEIRNLCISQKKEMGRGGADLIRLDRNPQLLPHQDITQFTENFIFNDKQHEVTYPLLENPDGIIYYRDKDKSVHFYHVNLETKVIRSLTPHFTTDQDRKGFKGLKASFESMEINSGRRSSNKEHQLISKIFRCDLIREGIRYEHKGIEYQDSQSAFQLISAYRTCLRLHKEDKSRRANVFWCKGVGGAQGEVMWLLQRICEKNRPFYPLPQHFKKFKRDFVFSPCWSSKEELVFKDGQLATGFGLKFALCKGVNNVAFGDIERPASLIYPDLIAVLRHVADAKRYFEVFKREPEHSDAPAGKNCSLQ